ncbi:MAG: 2-C-methyl-D-erythritol 4-phosphate cytidylyltransferase [Roseibacillus sp.]|nr:2-C-methyl-D-erythritol 4-phosphate cytidylyltransferase [Roseibacillus sp.]|tara:strand:+ start:1350 stop:2018 length:669 start_codon:yes stop_codon:yes gene_type:complete
MSCAAIIVAAGKSQRMGFDKMLSILNGQPVLQWTLDAFLEAEEIDVIMVVTSAERFAKLDPGSGKPVLRIEGDQERYLSVIRGMEALPSEPDYITVHDGARPLVLPSQINAVVQTARTEGAAALARRMTETVKRTNDECVTSESLSRENLWIMETPQAFRFDTLSEAYKLIQERGIHVTDEVSAAEAVGVTTKLVENQRPNPKVTVSGDLPLAEAILNSLHS